MNYGIATIYTYPKRVVSYVAPRYQAPAYLVANRQERRARPVRTRARLMIQGLKWAEADNIK